MVKNPTNKVYVIGVGMSKFIKPRGQVDYPGNINNNNKNNLSFFFGGWL